MDLRKTTYYKCKLTPSFFPPQFIEKFKEVKEMTRQQLNHSTSPPTVNGTDTDTPTSSATTTPRDTPNRGFFHTRSSSLTSMRDNNVSAEWMLWQPLCQSTWNDMVLEKEWMLLNVITYNVF